MAASLDMFGPGGEALGGLFMGNQMAMQRDQAAADQAKIAADIANTQAITQQRQLGNEYESAILGDKIQAYKDAATQTKEKLQLEKFERQGEQFGRLGQMLSGVPGPARQAALKQMAGQAGITEDNPLLQQFMQADPEALPDIMDKFSRGFYEQGEKGRAELLKRDLMMQQKKAELAAKSEDVRAQIEGRTETAKQHNETLKAIAAMREGGANQRAAAKAGAAGGKAPPVLTTDKAIADLIMRDDSLTPDQKLEALQKYKFQLPGLGKTDTSSITGLPSKQQQVEAAVRGSKPSGTQAAPAPQTKAPAAAGGDIAAAVKNTGQSYEPNKYEYQVTPDGRVLRRPKQAAVPK